MQYHAHEPGSWISKNWIAKWRWMVATVLAYKIWHFIIGCIQLSSLLFQLIYIAYVFWQLLYLCNLLISYTRYG